MYAVKLRADLGFLDLERAEKIGHAIQERVSRAGQVSNQCQRRTLGDRRNIAICARALQVGEDLRQLIAAGQRRRGPGRGQSVISAGNATLRARQPAFR